MKMKERFHAVCRFLNMISQGNHRVLFWLFGSAFAAATLPYLSLFFSARILNLLLAESYRACLYTVVVFLLVQYGLGLFEKICRLYEPTSGYITLNGIDIRKYNYKEYTQAFSVVFQDFHLFSLPLDENIAAGTTIDEAALQSSLAKVGLTDRVQQLPQGARTRLYNNNGSGVDLSGGEAQRTAIARALYKDAPFVILDEPTAALDPIAEAEIYEQFSQAAANSATASSSSTTAASPKTEPTTPSSQTTASTPIFTKPRPNTTPESSPSRPPQRKWESEKHNPWQFVLRTSKGCVFLAPRHLFQECKRLLIMNKMHQMIRTHNCYIFFL